MNVPIAHLGRIFRRLAVGLLELTNPAVHVRLHAAALARTEIIDAALSAFLIARRRRNRVSGQPHRPLLLGFPARWSGPANAGPGIGSEVNCGQENEPRGAAMPQIQDDILT